MPSHYANAARNVLRHDKMSIALTNRLCADFQPCLIDDQDWKATRAAYVSETSPKLSSKSDHSEGQMRTLAPVRMLKSERRRF